MTTTTQMYGSSSCCQETYKPSFMINKEDKAKKVLLVLQKVSAVVLGVLAALTSFWLFLPSFVIGAAVGAYHSKDGNHAHHHHHYKAESACSHGYIEQATGVKLPDSIALAAGFAVMAVHVDHHPFVFVPIIGLTLGMWAGKLAAPSINLCFKKIETMAANNRSINL